MTDDSLKMTAPAQRSSAIKGDHLHPLPEREQILSLAPFQGLDLPDIHVVETAHDAERAVAALRAAGLAGFDTESKPTFAKHEVSGGPHVVQFATRHEAWLFQLHRGELHGRLVELLASAELRKVGFGLASDLALIRRRFGIEPGGMFDIDDEFRRRGYRRSIGVKMAVALVFDQRFVKSRKASTSNWASRQLSEAQRRYAANDAYAALRVFEALGPASGG
jgi:ribonuclease D